MSSEIPEGIRSFFEGKIDSVELVHVLMLLHDRPDEGWTVRKISGELRSSESSVTKRVQTLVERGVLSAAALREETVRYEPLDAAIGARIDEALEYYRVYPYRVVDLIFSRRTAAIRSIADAFRFRRGD